MTIARIEDVAAGFLDVAKDIGAMQPNVRKLNTEATRAPLSSDNEAQGFAPGSRWQWQGQEWTAAQIGGALRWIRTGRITPAQFGALLDGVTDDTQAIRAMHEYCNMLNIPPSYDGVKTFALQADAQIAINTDVEFCGALIRVLGGVVALDGWSSVRNTLFVIADPDRPLVTGTVPVTSANFKRGSYDSCAELIPGAGFVMMRFETGTSIPQIANRDMLTTRTWRLGQKVYADRKTQWPLPVDGFGVTSVHRSYRLNSERDISVGGATFLLSDFTNQRLFDVLRNGVTVRDLVFSEGAGAPARTTCELIRPYFCSDWTVLRISGRNPSNDQNLGTYTLRPESTANGLVRDCNLRGGNWGWQAGDFNNGLRFENCDVSRVDTHDYSANIFVDGCTLHTRGVAIGAGGGVLSITNTMFHQTRSDIHLLQGRPDYGRGAWDGEVIIDGCTIIAQEFPETVIANFGSFPLGNAQAILNFPRSIRVTNCMVQQASAAPNITTVITPIWLQVSPTGQGVRAPRYIEVANIACSHRAVVFNNTLDLASCLSPVAGATDEGCVVKVTGLVSTRFLDANRTLRVLAASAAPKDSFRLSAFIEGCERATISIPAWTFSGSKLRVRGGSASRADIPDTINCRYQDVDFEAPLIIAPETHAPIAAAASGSRYTTITGGRLAGDYDLRPVQSVVGLITNSTGTLTALLPAGVTRQQLFTGWMAA